ncbi:M20 family metallopeptidase [Paenibacillus hexagrammi]|uniref:M20/M25/M40 family metallo-hydrolase n=1 Tax=Paenibacillus hexagrammi TaxID=2908839 RepID=A0ABY3SNK2_9BACL|nr:M20/M25/M40 family metallo-hydrolase [Paenibacillus sp. YPD9-1]UJF35534.1 M20/M25/M40 family metallo-hydrolase [Paenibacillus sp. YPD9-1]
MSQYLDGIGFRAEKQFLHPDLREHEQFIPHHLSHISQERFNVKAINKVKIDARRKVLFNVHMDVVPAGVEFEHAFSPFIRDNYLYGRGACDTKNNLIMLVEAIRFLQEHNIALQKEVEMDLVIEEEISGSGTLSSILHGIEADAVIVMEPTNLLAFRGHRGVITTTVEIQGKSVHMGGIDSGVNAIECAYHLIYRLKRFEAELLEEARSNKAFSIWHKPLQVNIGIIEGGEWPGSVPEHCRLVFNTGFLTNYTISDIKQRITEICRSTADGWTNDHITVKFEGLKNSAYLTDEMDDSLRQLMQSINRYGVVQEHSYGWRVSCDAHLYHSYCNLPTLIFGCGDLSDAHSAHEKVNLSELERGMLILAEYLSTP